MIGHTYRSVDFWLRSSCKWKEPAGIRSNYPMHARFDGKRNKSRRIQRWIDNINEDIASLGLTERNNGLDKGPSTMEVTHSYPSPPNGWRQELMIRRRWWWYWSCTCIYQCYYIYGIYIRPIWCTRRLYAMMSPKIALNTLGICIHLRRLMCSDGS